MAGESSLGIRLPVVASAGIGPTMNLTVVDDIAYAIGSGTLNVLNIGNPNSLVPLGRLTGLGSVRQIAVQNGIACITAREGGLFLVDVSDPRQPALLCHYDTVEWATGIAMQGALAYVACRHYGVELVDIRDPRRPRHVSVISTGEAQSVQASGRFIYTGVWATRELVVIDAGDPWRPVITARCQLDGYGDGLDICGDYCFAATGHHARGASPGILGGPVTREMILSGYGCGHGLEIFHLGDPAHPTFVSRIKFPPLYCIFNDMWNVLVAGRYAFVADTWNGVFVVDISDPSRPQHAGYAYLDYESGGHTAAPGGDNQLPMGEIYARSGYCLQPVRKPVGGLYPVKDHILAAGIYSDLHVSAAKGLAETPRQEQRHISITGEPAARTVPGFTVYHSGGQARQVAALGDTVFLAAGMAGLHVLDIPAGLKLNRSYATSGLALDVQVRGDRVYVAEGLGGLSIWALSGDSSLSFLGRYQVPGKPVKQVVVPDAEKPCVLLDVGADAFHVVDVSAPDNPHLLLQDHHLGLLYGDQIARTLLHQRYACAFWHVSGIYWYDLQSAESQMVGRYPHRMSPVDGLTVLDDAVLVTYHGAYFLLTPGETRTPAEMPMHGVDGVNLSGKPAAFGRYLLIANRPAMRLAILDIAERTRPLLLKVIELHGHPGPCVLHEGQLLIPAGHQGLLAAPLDT